MEPLRAARSDGRGRHCYLCQPENAVVLSIDEKTGILAKHRKHPATPVRKGRPTRREFEYVRHGTASLVASLDVTTDKVRARDIVRNDSVAFISFLTEIDKSVEESFAIHVVLDNGPSHISKATRAWLAEHPRFVVHHTPANASWLNQVEVFFSILTRKLLCRGKFSPREDLVAKMMAFIEHHSESAKPFKWVYDAKVAV